MLCIPSQSLKTQKNCLNILDEKIELFPNNEDKSLRHVLSNFHKRLIQRTQSIVVLLSTLGVISHVFGFIVLMVIMIMADLAIELEDELIFRLMIGKVFINVVTMYKYRYITKPSSIILHLLEKL